MFDTHSPELRTTSSSRVRIFSCCRVKRQNIGSCHSGLLSVLWGTHGWKRPGNPPLTLPSSPPPSTPNRVRKNSVPFPANELHDLPLSPSLSLTPLAQKAHVHDMQSCSLPHPDREPLRATVCARSAVKRSENNFDSDLSMIHLVVLRVPANGLEGVVT